MTSPFPTPMDLEILAVQAGISMAEACRRSGLSPDVFQRWKAGRSSPMMRSVQVLQDTLNKAVAAAQDQDASR